MPCCIKHTSRSHQGPSGAKNQGLTYIDWYYHKIAHQKWCDHPFSSANETWQQKEQCVEMEVGWQESHPGGQQVKWWTTFEKGGT